MSILMRIHASVFHTLDRVLGDWFLGLAARFVFAAVLFLYFFRSALTKVGDGFLGFFQPSVGAYAQIFPKLTEQVSYVMTYTDINGHDVGAETIGSLFSRDPSSLIADQRTLWVFVLLVLVLKGPGFISLDALLGRRLRR